MFYLVLKRSSLNEIISKVIQSILKKNHQEYPNIE
jgi:hypothetical protein